MRALTIVLLCVVAFLCIAAATAHANGYQRIADRLSIASLVILFAICLLS